MARIRYPDPSQYEREPLAERIKRERGGKVLNLYKMLLHSPPVAEGWLAFLHIDPAARGSPGPLSRARDPPRRGAQRCGL